MLMKGEMESSMLQGKISDENQSFHANCANFNLDHRINIQKT